MNPKRKPKSQDLNGYREITDLTGKHIGSVTVLHDDIIRNRKWWTCRCDCGAITNIPAQVLRTRKTIKACPSCREKIRQSPEYLDGRVFRSFETTAYQTSPAINKVYASYHRTAKVRGYNFALDLDQFIHLTSQNCYYCGIPPTRTITFGKHKFTFNGIDRADNTRGYEIGNCRTCCTQCNMAKGSLSEASFYAWVRRAFKHSAQSSHKKSAHNTFNQGKLFEEVEEDE